MSKQKWYIIFVILIFYSCQKEKVIRDKTIIPVAEAVGTGEILNLSDYARSIEYIPLETSDTVLIGDIQELIYESGHIVLYDFQGKICKLFYEDGSYKKQLGRKGQGGGEYTFIRAMSFIPETKKIFLNTIQRYYLYNLDGIMEKSIPLVEAPPPFIVPTTVAITDSLYLSHLVAMNDFRYRALVWGKNDTQSIYKLYPNHIKWNNAEENHSYGVSTYKWRFRDQVRCYWPETDTIFTIDSNLEMKKAFVFDFGIYARPLKWRLGSAPPKEGRISKTIGVHIQIHESSRYLFLQFVFNGLAPEVFFYKRRNPRGYMQDVEVRNVYGLFDKLSGKLTLLNQPVKRKYLGFKNDMDGGPCFWPKYVSSDNKMVAWFTASDFLDIYEQLENPSPTLKKMVARLSPDDNPILMVVTLK